MGNKNVKEEQKQMVIREEELGMRAKYLSGMLEQAVDKEVNLLMKTERVLLEKYSEERRTIEDLLFKDEVSTA